MLHETSMTMVPLHRRQITAVVAIVTLQLSIVVYTIFYYARTTPYEKRGSLSLFGNQDKLPSLLADSCTDDPKKSLQPHNYSSREVDDRPRLSSLAFEVDPSYVRIKNESQHLDLHCEVCAVVSSSGQLLGRNAGNEIDNASCVIRMNRAPTKGYEADVGTRTTVRIVGFLGIAQGHYTKSNFFGRESSPGKIVVWTNYNKDAMKKESLKLMEHNSGLDMYITTDEHLRFCDALFKEETGRSRGESKSWLSTGWFTMVFALKNCEQVKVYGMIPYDHCDKNQSRSMDVPYHYYDGNKIKECDVSKAGETRATGGHRYMTEKYIFQRWSKAANISFHFPTWNITDEPQDQPLFLKLLTS